MQFTIAFFRTLSSSASKPGGRLPWRSGHRLPGAPRADPRMPATARGSYSPASDGKTLPWPRVVDAHCRPWLVAQGVQLVPWEAVFPRPP